MKRLLAIVIGSASLVLVALLAASFLQLSAIEIPSELETNPSEPSRLYTRPLQLERRAPLDPDDLEAYLVATAHRKVAGPDVERGEYARAERSFAIGSRAFTHPTGDAPGGTLRVEISGRGQITSLRGPDGERARRLWLQPAEIGRFAPDDGRDQRPVPLAAMPQTLVDAVLAIEDQRFYEHAGLDLRRIAGAVVANLRAGRVVQGGSTLTQQLVKNLYLTRERSWLRKLQEAPIAMLLELRHSKQAILEAYLNEVYLGQSGGLAIHGVGRASEHWFGKPVEDLVLHEAALLAGMLRGPSLYSPRRDPELARKRRDLVLARMHEQGVIDDDALTDATGRTLSVIARRRVPSSSRYFRDTLRGPLEERYALERLQGEGLAVYTSLDLRLQRIAERAVRAGVARLEERKPSLVDPAAPLQAALVAVDPHNGDLLAMVGGRDYGRSQFNRANEARRQPGSLFKTVAALAALTSYRSDPPPYTLATLVDDAPLALETPEGDWEPGNHDSEFRGLVTFRQMIEHSLNVPMIRVGMELGPRRVVRAARRLGIESRMRGVPSLVLGTSEVTLLEMTRAYGVLAAEGWRAEPRHVLGVADASGGELERAVAKGGQTLQPAEAHLVTSALRGVVDRGTGYGLRARGFAGPLAGKTGTTDDYRDAWFVGYGRDLAVGVWVGFDDGRTLRHSGAGAALPIFTDFVIDALGPYGGREFRIPLGVHTVHVVAAEGHASGLRCSGDPEVFLDGTAPTERCDPFDWLGSGERTYRISEYPRPVDEEGRPIESDDLPDVAAPAPPEEEADDDSRRGLRLPRWLNPFLLPGESLAGIRSATQLPMNR